MVKLDLWDVKCVNRLFKRLGVIVAAQVEATGR